MLGTLLREAREAKGLTQVQLALRAGVDRSYLSEVERDRKNPTVDMFLRLCRAMEVPAADIIRKLDASRPKRK